MLIILATISSGNFGYAKFAAKISAPGFSCHKAFHSFFTKKYSYVTIFSGEFQGKFIKYLRNIFQQFSYRPKHFFFDENLSFHLLISRFHFVPTYSFSLKRTKDWLDNEQKVAQKRKKPFHLEKASRIWQINRQRKVRITDSKAKLIFVLFWTMPFFSFSSFSLTRKLFKFL